MGIIFLIIGIAVIVSYGWSWSKMPGILKEWTDKSKDDQLSSKYAQKRSEIIFTQFISFYQEVYEIV